MYTNISNSIFELASVGHFNRNVDQEVRILTTSSSRTAVSTGYETVWTETGTYKFPTAAHPLSVVSTSVNDSASGTNARTIRITGLDADYNVISEDITLNGVTPVVTTKSFLRVNLTIVTSGGPLTVNGTIANLGKITVTQTVSNLVLDTIVAGFNVSRKCVWSIPRGYRASILSEKQCVGSYDDVSFFTAVRAPSGVIYSYDEKIVFRNTTSSGYLLGEPIPEMYDIAVYAKAVTSSALSAAQFQLLLSKIPV